MSVIIFKYIISSGLSFIIDIISELYYKQGFKDGVEFALKNIK